MASHTPGPWIVDCESGNDGEAECIAAADGARAIAHTTNTFDDDAGEEVITDEDRANGRLIAAAPELLAALRKCADRLGEMDCGPELDEARRAIAKAQGAAR